MADINLLSDAAPKKDDKEAAARAPKDEEMKLHVPPPEPELPPEKPLSGLLPPKPAIPVPQAPASILNQKIQPIPVAPAAPKPAAAPMPQRMTVPVAPRPLPRPPLPPAPPPPKPPAPPRPAAPEDMDGGGTLRVSLITTGAGAGLSEIALRSRLRTFALIGLLGLVIDGLIFGVLLYQKSAVEKRNAAAEQQIQDIDARIAAREKDLAPVRDFQQLVRMESTVLQNHEHWTGVLKLLEETALPQVQFGSLAGADTGTLTFEVFARDYTTLAKQIVAFRQDPRVLTAVTGTATADFAENNLLKGVRSEMTLTVDPKIFKFNPAKTAAPSSATSTPTP